MNLNWFRKNKPEQTGGPNAPSKPAVPDSDTPTPSAPTMTRSTTPHELRGLSHAGVYAEEEIKELALGKKAEFYPAGSLLFRRGQGDRTLFFLLEGTVLLEPVQGRAPEVAAGTPQASFPLNAGNRYAMSAYAKTDAWVLRVPEWEWDAQPESQKILDPVALSNKYPTLKNDSLFFVFAETFASNNLKLPTMPTVALRLRDSLAKNADIAEASRILQAEPVIAAKIIEIANSPVFRTTQTVTSCLQAMSMLGVETTLGLVTGLCTGGLYVAKKPLIRQTMVQTWRKSVYISAIAAELAKKTLRISPDKAVLAGLFSHIGALPYLTFLDEHPDVEEYEGDINAALSATKGLIGAQLLKSWGVPDEVAMSPKHIDNWFYNDGKPTLSLQDVLILANWHSQLGQSGMALVPPLTSLPAYTKLDEGELGPELSLVILSTAKDEVRQLIRLLA